MDYVGEVILEIPGHKINVNPYKLKKRDAESLCDKITQARIKITAYGKVPPKPDESREDWLTRYADFLAEQRKPKDGELASDYVGRMLEPTAFKDSMDFLYEITVACADLVNQGSKITEDVFEELSLLEVENFIKPITKICRIPLPELAEAE